ncbi:13643_t:CDS:2 [Dentiscutata erythropus]|uniref:13643_t:CDS:1 n=1 Tax=Dentiscutata erythropus TaxID=1348616 RepID=A0A9N8Z7M6_9GLOM|nr:13643_t:CDS:2 [Dentiscutata erythropus]
MSLILLWIILLSEFLCEALVQIDIPTMVNGSYDSTILSSNCSLPLIWYSGPFEEGMICNGSCCLSCPYLDNFYPENDIKNAFEIFAIFGIISFFLMLLLSVLFLLLPSQRRNPTAKQLLLPLALSVCYFEGSEFFTIQQQNSQCINNIRRANLENPMCKTQAIFTLGGAYAIAICSSLLMIHLHLISIWKSDFITRHIKIFHALTIIITLTATILPIVLNKVEATNICFVSTQYSPVTFRANWRRDEPDNRTTVRLSFFEAQQTLTHVRNIIRIQWRASLGAFLMLTVYLVNWIFYTYKLPHLGNEIESEWLQQWNQCLANGTQSTCAVYANDHVPSYNWIITILFFNRFCGILIFFLFAGKKTIFIELWECVTRKPRPTSIHSNPSVTERRRSNTGNSMKKRLSIISISSGRENTPVSTSLNSSLSAPYPTSILMGSNEDYPFKVDKSSKRLTFSSFTTDNNYVIEPAKTRDSLTYAITRYNDSVNQNETFDNEQDSLAEIIEN